MSPLRRAQRTLREWRDLALETVRLTHDSVAAHPLRSILAVLGIVIGIVTVVLVASILANVRNSVALLFRELGTENVFAYHRSGDPYSPPSEKEARRLPLKPAFAELIAREGRHVRAKPGERDAARVELESVLRRLRRLGPDEPNDFELSTADQIIGTLDQVSAAVGLATFALAAVSLLIGGIGIANVMIIAVTERTREIGVRRALGARRSEVRRQFLLEAAFLSATGGLAGVLVASLLGLLITVFAPGFSAVAPAWAVLTGLGASVLTGIVAGYLPARRAALLDPVEALRYE